MDVSARTTEAALAATVVNIEQTLARWKRIDELLKSTDASLARIGRLQNLTQPLVDSSPRMLEATEKVLQAAPPTLSTTTPLVVMPTTGSTSSIGLGGRAVHNKQDHVSLYSPLPFGAPEATSWSSSPLEEQQQLSARHMFDGMTGRQELTTSHVLQVTVTCVLYPVSEKVLHQVFDPYGVNEICVLQQTTHTKAFVEFQSWREAATARSALHGQGIYDCCCYLHIQYASPSVIIVSPTPPIVAPAVATMMDQGCFLVATTPPFVPWRYQVVAACAPQVEDNHAAITHARCSTCNLGVDAGVQLSALTHDATPCATVAAVVLNGEFKHDIEPFSKEDCDGVLIHIGAMPLFVDLDLCVAEERLAQRPLKDIACNKELADQMLTGDQLLTEVGGMSVSIESDLDSDQEHDRFIDTTTPKEEGKLQHFLSKEMQQHGTNRDTQVLPWDPGKEEAVIKGLFDLLSHAEICIGQFISRSRKNAKAAQLATKHFLNKMPSWRRSGFSPSYYLQPHLGIMASSSREVRPDYLLIILAKFDTYSVERLVLYKCILNDVRAAVCILLNLTLGDVFCLIRKIFRSAVSPIDMIQKSYHGNNIQIYEGSVCTVANQHNFHVDF